MFGALVSVGQNASQPSVFERIALQQSLGEQRAVLGSIGDDRAALRAPRGNN